MIQDRFATSRARQIAAFFEANPDEYMTLADIATRFDCTLAQAKNAMRFLQIRGVTSSAHHHFLNPERSRDETF